jgi:hypothetical protein
MLILVLILAAAVYGFAAANTVPATSAGDGDNAVNGYTITNLDFDLQDGDTDPSDIDTVTFTLGADASEAYVAFSDDGGTTWSSWVSCTISGTGASTAASCTSVNYSVSSANRFRVIAAE